MHKKWLRLSFPVIKLELFCDLTDKYSGKCRLALIQVRLDEAIPGKVAAKYVNANFSTHQHEGAWRASQSERGGGLENG